MILESAAKKTKTKTVFVSKVEKRARQGVFLIWHQCKASEVGEILHATTLKCSTEEYHGNDNHRCQISSVSNIKDRTGTDPHKRAILVLKKQQVQAGGDSPSTYALITKAVQEIPDDGMAIKLPVKFVNLFSKYPALCELEVQHGGNQNSVGFSEEQLNGIKQE